MVVYNDLSDAEVDRIFRALADSTRRDIMRRTLIREASVSAIAESYDMSFAAVQKHVAVLADAGLVTKHQRGRQRIVRANVDQVARAQTVLGHLQQLWSERFSQIDDVLANPSIADPPTKE